MAVRLHSARAEGTATTYTPLLAPHRVATRLIQFRAMRPRSPEGLRMGSAGATQCCWTCIAVPPRVWVLGLCAASSCRATLAAVCAKASRRGRCGTQRATWRGCCALRSRPAATSCTSGCSIGTSARLGAPMGRPTRSRSRRRPGARSSATNACWSGRCRPSACCALGRRPRVRRSETECRARICCRDPSCPSSFARSRWWWRNGDGCEQGWCWYAMAVWSHSVGGSAGTWEYPCDA
jgi:hypothetical protein